MRRHNNRHVKHAAPPICNRAYVDGYVVIITNIWLKRHVKRAYRHLVERYTTRKTNKHMRATAVNVCVCVARTLDHIDEKWLLWRRYKQHGYITIPRYDVCACVCVCMSLLYTPHRTSTVQEFGSPVCVSVYPLCHWLYMHITCMSLSLSHSLCFCVCCVFIVYVGWMFVGPEREFFTSVHFLSWPIAGRWILFFRYIVVHHFLSVRADTHGK